MRILAIRGRNLASLAGDFAVDFREGALANAGIFAITGPTGAGKSTLLDAMSLALFDTIPRLEAAPSTGQLTGDDLNPRDPRLILRHGAGEGFAELDFVGRDGRSYRSRWTVRRARERAEGKLQQTALELECLDTGERLGGRKGETKEEILRLIGLNAQQFGRAVVLAQGEFEAFIRATGDERAHLLEKLTGASIYSRIGRLAFERARDVRAGYTNLEGQIAAQDGLSDEERAALEAERLAADAARAEKASAHDSLVAARDWARRRDDLAQRLQAARKELAVAEAAQAAAVPRRDALARRRQAHAHVAAWQRLVEMDAAVRQGTVVLASLREAEELAAEALSRAHAADSDATEAMQAARLRERQAAPLLEAARNADLALDQATRRLADADVTLRRLRSEQDSAARLAADATAAVDAARTQCGQLEEWREANVALEGLALREAELQADLDAYAIERDRIAGLEAALHRAREAHRAADEASARTAAQEVECEQARKAAAEALACAEAAMPDSSRGSALERERDALLALRACQSASEEARARLAQTDQALAGTLHEAARLQAAQAQRDDAQGRLQAELPVLQAYTEESARAADRALAAAGEAAAALRETLQDGEPCPVCGATEHRLSALDAVLGEAAEEARARASATAGALAKMRDRLIVLGVEGTGARTTLERLEEVRTEQLRLHEGCRLDCARAAHDVAEALGAAGLPAEGAGEGLPELIENRLSGIAEERDAIAAAAQSVVIARQAEREAREAHEAARNQHSEALAGSRTVQEAVSIAVRALETTTGEERRLGSALDTRLAPLADWRALPGVAAWLTGRAGEWRDRAGELRSLEARMPQFAEQKARAAAEAQAAERALEAAQVEQRAATDERQQRLTQRAGLLDGQPADPVALGLAEAVRRAERSAQEAAAVVGTARTQAAEARTRRQEAERALHAAQADHGTRAQAFVQALETSGIAPDEVAHAAALDESTIAAEEQALAELDTARTRTAAALAERERDLAEHAANQRPGGDGADLDQRTAEARTALDETEAALQEVVFRLRRDDDARAKTQRLRAELAAARDAGRVWEELAELIGDATGKRFRNYAQSLTLDRLLDCANGRLSELKPRYALQRAPGGEMLIEVVDNDMAGQARGLQNLSGGERFLISLALALGLAEMSTGRGVRIDSLFIDEGFGALDSASLGQALAVLEHLHAQGRRVGVISHVEELKERIPVKVEVSPGAGGRSAIAVVVD